MSNLSMESNIKNIQYQIDMAKKQYNTAGNSITDTQQKKEDMKSALDKINDSIGDMESSYNNMKNMAKTAKQYVYQDTYGVWRWITDPEPNWGKNMRHAVNRNPAFRNLFCRRLIHRQYNTRR